MWLSESGRKEPKEFGGGGNEEVKASVTRKKVAWKEMLAANNEEAKGKMYGSLQRRKKKG